MAKLDTCEASSVKRVMVYGAPKSGKTELVGRLAEKFNLIWVDLENGHDTLFKMPKDWQSRIELISLPDTRSFPIGIESCLKIIKGTPVVVCEEHGKVGCMSCKKDSKPAVDLHLNSVGLDTIVVFDSATQLTDSASSFITKGKPDDYKLDYDDWGNLGKLLSIFYSHVQNAPFHIVVISHETEVETEGKKKTLVPVSGTKNFGRNVAKYFGDVVYCERKNKKHCFSSSTTYASNILAASRTDVRLEDSDEPSLLSIFMPDAVPTPREQIVPTASPRAQGAGSKAGGGGASSILDKLKSRT